MKNFKKVYALGQKAKNNGLAVRVECGQFQFVQIDIYKQEDSYVIPVTKGMILSEALSFDLKGLTQ